MVRCFQVSHIKEPSILGRVGGELMTHGASAGNPLVLNFMKLL
jgi:hypothetical protein